MISSSAAIFFIYLLAADSEESVYFHDRGFRCREVVSSRSHEPLAPPGLSWLGLGYEARSVVFFSRVPTF